MLSDPCSLAELASKMQSSFPRLSFRLFRGEEDYEQMERVLTMSCEADGFQSTTTPDDLATSDRLSTQVDHTRHRLIVEDHDRMIGFTTVHVEQLEDGPTLYTHAAHLHEEWRKAGLRRSLLAWNEAVIAEISSSSRDAEEAMFEACANNSENDWKRVLEYEGYKPTSHVLEMVRPNLENIPILPLPDGVEVRQAIPEHYRAIWNLAKEAARDHRDFSEDFYTEERFHEWLKGPEIQPHLWQIAWSNDEVIGTVRSHIQEHENMKFNRLRGYTEHIHVARKWRRKGIASALLARSLAMLRDHGMREAALDVDAENLSGALRMYERLGFRKHRHFVFYRKPII